MTAPQDPFATPSGDRPAAQPYSAPGFGDPAPAQPRNGLGTTAFVLGLLALLTFWTMVGGVVLGVLAVVLGAVARGRAKRREATNGGLAVAGIVLGLVGLILSAGMIAFLASDTGRDLRACFDRSTTQAERDQCSEDVVNDLTAPPS